MPSSGHRTRCALWQVQGLHRHEYGGIPWTDRASILATETLDLSLYEMSGEWIWDVPPWPDAVWIRIRSRQREDELQDLMVGDLLHIGECWWYRDPHHFIDVTAWITGRY